MTNRLDKLETKGLIVREHSKQDRRSVTVELTAKGLMLIDKLIVEHVEVQRGFMHDLSDEEKLKLNEALKNLLPQFE
jgi:DNA-binding MarR family transcriptional regulator